MKIILLILILAKISCQEDKAVKLMLASSASGILAGGFYGSLFLLDESTNYGISKIKLLSESQKLFLKKSLVLAGTFGLSRAFGFSNEGAAVITGSSVVANLIGARIESLKNGNHNFEAYASAATAGLISTATCYKLLSQKSATKHK
jgi:hypothetical protein